MPMGVDYVVIGFDMEVQPLVTHNAAWPFCVSAICIDVVSRAREVDKCQSVRQDSKWWAISGKTYGNSWLDVCVQIYVTFEFWTNLDKGYQREFWWIYLYIATFPIS